MQCLHASVCVGIKQFIYTVLYRERARILIFCIETHVRASHFAVLQRSRVRTSHHLNIPDDVCAYARTKSQHAGTCAYARTKSQHAGTCVRMHVLYLNMLARVCVCTYNISTCWHVVLTLWSCHVITLAPAVVSGFCC